SIKEDERFAKTPVVLLISSFEPYDEAEARRVGADDVVTKPFQSIRQLVSRVGSLLSKGKDEPEMTHEYSAWGGGPTDRTPAPAPGKEPSLEPPVKVFVEAPVMDSVNPHEPAEMTPADDLELETADTMQLEPVHDDLKPAADDMSFRDTLEVEPVTATVIDEPAPAVFEPVPAEFSFSEMKEPVVSA